MNIKLEKPGSAWDWLRLCALYQTAFPASERKPFSIIRKNFYRDHYSLRAAAHLEEF